ncbi:MAG: hypothetical protein J6P58_09455 [Oscillospiraceae bacterium]|nr:hypothetical protein [Oscillospiraceae bacterium]
MNRLEAASSDEQFREKLFETFKRLAEENPGLNDSEVMVKAAAEFGYTITAGELERFDAKTKVLDPDDLAKVSGGVDNRPGHDLNCWKDYLCTFVYIAPLEDEYGHNSFCWTAWHCFAAMLHTESEDDSVYCWSNYICAFNEGENNYSEPNHYLYE